MVPHFTDVGALAERDAVFCLVLQVVLTHPPREDPGEGALTSHELRGPIQLGSTLHLSFGAYWQ